MQHLMTSSVANSAGDAPLLRKEEVRASPGRTFEPDITRDSARQVRSAWGFGEAQKPFMTSEPHGRGLQAKFDTAATQPRASLFPSEDISGGICNTFVF